MWVLLGTVFVASLLGSLHCVGMCGPFAVLASATDEKRKSALLPATAYSFGRLITYAMVGAIFGSMGMALSEGTSYFGGADLESVQQKATWIAGGLMILIGVIALARQFGIQITLPNFIGKRVQPILQNGYQRVRKLPRVRRAFLIGTLTCLMPCGWLYTFAIVAAGTSSPLLGAAVMVTFWSGTVPIMTLLMMGFGKLGPAIQQKIPMAMALTVILVGCFTIAFRAPAAIGSDRVAVEGNSELIQQVQAADHTEMPCCASD